MRPFSRPITPADVAGLVDFRVAGDERMDSMHDLQCRGVAGLWNILCERPYSYLADEVGMGKTYQALGLASLLWSVKPDARIVFICPAEKLQRQWETKYRSFFTHNYRQGRGDDRVSSVLTGEPVHRPLLAPRLEAWVRALGSGEPTAAFLRLPSFRRPVWIQNPKKGEIRALWNDKAAWMASLGLREWAGDPGRSAPWTASYNFNLAFGQALNGLLDELGRGEPAIDLVVVDEAQNLRNSGYGDTGGNQGNSVFHAIFGGQVRHWLFLSATPAHSGVHDLCNVLNHYPQADHEPVPPELLSDLPALQATLERFLIRRQRKYLVGGQSPGVGRTEYREHDIEAMSTDADRPLDALAMGLVQKGLVPVLEARNNRYHIGFLSSFESLQASVRDRQPPTADSRDAERDPGATEGEEDWHSKPTQDEPEAPDTKFIAGLAERFEAEFGHPLAHPKLDTVAAQLAQAAFRNPRPEKALVFTRRRSTTGALRDRLDWHFHRAIEDRIEDGFGLAIDWERGFGGGPDDAAFDEDDDDERAVDEQSSRELARAFQKGGWLNRYRLTFARTGRNALFFEEPWLGRLAREQGEEPRRLAERIPKLLWAKSRSDATVRAGARDALLRARRLQWLSRHAARELGLPADWCAWLAERYPDCEPTVSPHRRPSPDHDLVTFRSLWVAWDERLCGTDLALPMPTGAAFDPASLWRREVLKLVIRKTLLLGDAILDLAAADETSCRTPDDLADRWLDWLTGSTVGAVRMRTILAEWIQHLPLILRHALELDEAQLPSLARRGRLPLLESRPPAASIVGGGHRVAVDQFLLPGAPFVIACTDTLKEGVNLHLFCDRVLHYGVAWTSGDLEQRIGRVDRFFSLVERKLAQSPGPPPAIPKLEVHYPHVRPSLERAQVQRVMARKKDVELLLDSPLCGHQRDTKTLSVDAEPARAVRQDLPGPLGELDFEGIEEGTLALPERSKELRDWYSGWLARAGSRLGANLSALLDQKEVFLGPSSRVRIGFVPELRRYTLTIWPAPWADDIAEHTAGMEVHYVDGLPVHRTVMRVLVPGIDEDPDDTSIRTLRRLLSSGFPELESGGPWKKVLVKTPTVGRPKRKGHKYKARVRLGERGQNVRIYAYEGMVRIVSPICGLDALDDDHARWGHVTQASVRAWAERSSAGRSLGWMAVHPRDGLLMGVRVGMAGLRNRTLRRLVRAVALWADAWEIALVGEDRG
jgi:hypothetical protein